MLRSRASGGRGDLLGDARRAAFSEYCQPAQDDVRFDPVRDRQHGAHLRRIASTQNDCRLGAQARSSRRATKRSITATAARLNARLDGDDDPISRILTTILYETTISPMKVR